MKVCNALCRDDTVHGIYYYLASEADLIIERLTAEVSRQKICIRAMTEEIQTLVREKVDAQEKIRTYQQGAYK